MYKRQVLKSPFFKDMAVSWRYRRVPVSYTHLDVYKRQVQQRVKLPPPGGFLRVAVRKEKLIYRNMIPRYKVIEHLQTRRLSLVPVSYTHLDVYKRQVCQHFGLDTSDYSFGYVAGWSSGKEMTELKASLETIHRLDSLEAN